eukprot:Phypoly_transcript_12504.p1 GENE.Phypoly_transcript_12504~~Phypoly_transcript_12504.p1  ORF type:complete len:254 (+),score=50.88 Phypoly_transcript_12504:36-764(+)
MAEQKHQLLPSSPPHHPGHKRVMIAVDHSIDSEYAFNETLKTFDKENDYLYIISVSQTIMTFPATAISAAIMIDAQQEADRKVHTLLVHYVNLCKKSGVKNFKTFLGTGGHAGEVICRAAEEKNIDVLVLGRRGLGRIKRLFIGSTSRYCVENAPCTVVCVKLPTTMENLDEHNVKFSDEVHKESADTFVHEPHPAHAAATPATTTTTTAPAATPATTSPTDAAHRMNVAAVPLVERYGHPV